MNQLLEPAILIGILTGAIRLATPYLYASIGEMFAQRSGVVNLGVDGIMLMGAFSGFFVALNLTPTMGDGALWLGLLAAVIVGILMGLLMSVVSVTLKAEQGISGIGLYIFGLGLSSLLFRVTIGTVKTIDGFKPAHHSGVEQSARCWPDPLLQQHRRLWRVPARPDRVVRARKDHVGFEDQSRGTESRRGRFIGRKCQSGAVLLRVSGRRVGRAGGCVDVVVAGQSLSRNLTAGLGFIAVALVYFGGWRPLGILIGALLFSTINSLQLCMQVLG